MAQDNDRRRPDEDTGSGLSADITVDAQGRHLHQTAEFDDADQVDREDGAPDALDRTLQNRLPADSQSLWWPDRNAQVVQATNVGPREAADFLRASIGAAQDDLRIQSVTERSPNEFEVQAQLHMRPTGWRGVKLRVFPTPSGNLSVIEMLPRRSWMPQTARYLAAGVPAITKLTDQIEAAADSV